MKTDYSVVGEEVIIRLQEAWGLQGELKTSLDNLARPCLKIKEKLRGARDNS